MNLPAKLCFIIIWLTTVRAIITEMKLFHQPCFLLSFVISSNASMYSRSKKKRNTPIYFNINYRTEMKLVPIIMDQCLLQFDVLKFFFGLRLHRGSRPNFNFFNVNSQIFQRNRKVHLSNCLEKNFHDIPNISLRDIRRRNYS